MERVVEDVLRRLQGEGEDNDSLSPQRWTGVEFAELCENAKADSDVIIVSVGAVECIYVVVRWYADGSQTFQVWLSERAAQAALEGIPLMERDVRKARLCRYYVAAEKERSDAAS